MNYLIHTYIGILILHYCPDFLRIVLVFYVYDNQTVVPTPWFVLINLTFSKIDSFYQEIESHLVTLA